MTERIIANGPNDIVAYPADMVSYQYTYTCQTCSRVFASDEPATECPHDKSKAVKQHLPPGQAKGHGK